MPRNPSVFVSTPPGREYTGLKGGAAMPKEAESNPPAVTVKYGASGSYQKIVEKLLRILIGKKLK